jgi:hypothetical protein
MFKATSISPICGCLSTRSHWSGFIRAKQMGQRATSESHLSLLTLEVQINYAFPGFDLGVLRWRATILAKRFFL